MDGLEPLHVTLLPSGEHTSRVSPSRRALIWSLCTLIEGGRLMRSCPIEASDKSIGRSSPGVLKRDLWCNFVSLLAFMHPSGSIVYLPTGSPDMYTAHFTISHVSSYMRMVCSAQSRRRNFSHLTGSWVFRQAVETVRLGWHGTLSANTVSNAWTSLRTGCI